MTPTADWKAIRTTLKPYLAMAPEFRKRFVEARSRLATLKKQTLATVTRWEWYTDFYHELDPMYFVLGYFGSDGEGKPGRVLKREPSSKLGSLRYGFDAQGRVVTDEKYLNSEEFREHKPGRIDTARFHTSKKCIDLQTLWLDKNQPKAYFRVNRDGLLIRAYEFKGGKIVSVSEAKFDNAATKTKTDWVFRHHSITEKRPGVFLIHTAYENGHIEKRGNVMPESSKNQLAPPVLDLRKDLKEVTAELTGCFAKIAKLQKAKGKESVPPISALNLEFHDISHSDPGLVLNFDCLLGHMVKGNYSWTHHGWGIIEKPKWSDFYAECECAGSRGVVIDARGKRNAVQIPNAGSRRSAWFGGMLVDALLAALKKHPLQLHPKCSFAVTDYINFSWERFALAGKPGLVQDRWPEPKAGGRCC